MKCPDCGYDNIAGIDECESCQNPFSLLDGIENNARSKIEKIILRQTLSELPRREAVCLPSDTSIHKVILKMSAMHSGSVLVGEPNDKKVGIITERNILFRLNGPIKHLKKIKAGEWMTSPVEGLAPDDTLAYALHFMSVRRYRHIPIFREGHKPLMTSARDLLRHLCQYL